MSLLFFITPRSSPPFLGITQYWDHRHKSSGHIASTTLPAACKQSLQWNSCKEGFFHYFYPLHRLTRRTSRSSTTKGGRQKMQRRLNLTTTSGKYKPPQKWGNSANGNPLCHLFQHSDTQRDVLRSNTRDLSVQEGMKSSVEKALLLSITSVPEGPILLLRHCSGTSKGSYGSEPGELPTSVFLPLLHISYRNWSGGRIICFLWNASSWLGTSDMIRYITVFIHHNTGSGLCIQFVAIDLLKRSLSNHNYHLQHSQGTQTRRPPLKPIERPSFLPGFFSGHVKNIIWCINPVHPPPFHWRHGSTTN